MGSFNKLSNLIAQLRNERMEFEKRLAEVDEQLRAVEITVMLCRNGEGVDVDIYETIIAKLRKAKAQDKTQLEALEMIAASNNGQLKVVNAKRLMLESGFISNPKTADSIIYTLIARSGKFGKINPGEYRLLNKHEIEERQGFTPSEWERQRQLESV